MTSSLRPLAAVLATLALACSAAEPTPAAATAGAERPAAEAAPGEETAAAPAPKPEPVDPVAASPDVYKVLLDSDRMRIVEATWQPGQRDKPHGHPELVAYGVTGFHGLSWSDDGKQASLRIREGNAFFQSPVESHSVENLGQRIAKVVFVELKPGKPVPQMPAEAEADAMSASPDVYDLVLLEARVRVLRATWKPGQVDELHGHPALAAYALTDVKGQLLDAKGKVISDIEQKAGTALFQDPVAAHRFKNVGDAEAQLLLIEPRD